MAKTPQVTTRKAIVRRRWLGIERLESRSMLHGDDCWSDMQSEFNDDFEFDDDFAADFSSDNHFSDEDQEFVAFSDFDSTSFDSDDYSASFDEFLVSEWDDESYEISFGFDRSRGHASWDLDFEQDDSFDSDFWDDDFQFERPELRDSFVVHRPQLTNSGLQRPGRAPFAPPPNTLHESSRPVELAFASNRPPAARDSLIQIIVAPRVVSVSAADAFLGSLSSATNDALAQTNDAESLNVSELDAEEVSTPAANIDSAKTMNPTALPQNAAPRTLGLDGMLSLDQANTATNDLKPQKAVEADAAGSLLDRKQDSGSTPNLDSDISEEPEQSSQPSRKNHNSLYHSNPGVKNQQLRQDEFARTDVSRRNDLWPEGMLSLEMVPTIDSSDAPLVASMDPLALVQLFIHADDDHSQILRSPIQAAEVQSEFTKVSTLRSWLRDPRISTIASIAFGIVAVATARRTNWRHSKETRPLSVNENR